MPKHPKVKPLTREERWAKLTYNSGQRAGKVFGDIPGDKEIRKGRAEIINNSLNMGSRN